MAAYLIILCLVAQGASLSVKSKVDQSMQVSPITKVVNLLKDMQSQLEKEAATDEDTYEKISCWCGANGKEKGKAVDIANQHIGDLGALTEELTAKITQLTTELSALKTEVADKSASLASAEEIRAKEAAEFHTMEKETIMSVGNLKAAVVALSKSQEGAALPQESLLQVQQLLRRHLPTSEHRQVVSLLQREDGAVSLDYEPASGAIFGVMKQMKEEFETNLVKNQKNEATAIADFGEMKAAKSEELAAAQDMIDTKTVELAAAKKKNSDSMQDLEDTTAALDADSKFLVDLKAKCAEADKEYGSRTKVRSEEIKAISEVLSILMDDDARQLAAKTTFLQMRTRTRRMSVRARAAAELQRTGLRTGSAALVLLAVSARSDVFAKVRDNIEKLIGELKTLQADEVKQKDFCRQEFHENDMQTTEKTDVREDTEQKIASLESTIKSLQAATAALHKAIAETHVQIKAGSENRIKESQEFQVVVADQRAMQEILKKALGRLQQFYGKSALFQAGARPVPGAAAPPMPPGFAPYKKNSGGAAGVAMMLEQVIEEAVAIEKEAAGTENEDQAAYASFVKDSNNAIAAMQASLTDKTQALADADKAKTQAQADLTAVVEELEQLDKYKVKLHSDCDFLMEHFEARQSARTEEIEGLQSAKQIFAQGR